MKVIILGGFLGSGKTTLLMQLAKHLVAEDTSGSGLSVMILENEVGEVGIDDQYLRGGGLRVNTLFSGCACCSLAGELIDAAKRIQAEYNPAWLIVETTGIAYPEKMQENLRQYAGLDARIVIVTDASRWRRIFIPMGQLLVGQIEGSDAVLINKTDKTDLETVASVERDIRGIEPGAAIVRVSALSELSAEIVKTVTGE